MALSVVLTAKQRIIELVNRPIEITIKEKKNQKRKKGRVKHKIEQSI